jgi:hypothetical protein
MEIPRREGGRSRGRESTGGVTYLAAIDLRSHLFFQELLSHRSVRPDLLGSRIILWIVPPVFIQMNQTGQATRRKNSWVWTFSTSKKKIHG